MNSTRIQLQSASSDSHSRPSILQSQSNNSIPRTDTINDKENDQRSATPLASLPQASNDRAPSPTMERLAESKLKSANMQNGSQKDDKRTSDISKPPKQCKSLAKVESCKQKESKASAKVERPIQRPCEKKRQVSSSCRETRAQDSSRKQHKRSRSNSREAVAVCKPKRQRLSRASVKTPPPSTPGRVSPGREPTPVSCTRLCYQDSGSVPKETGFPYYPDVDMEAAPHTPGGPHTPSPSPTLTSQKSFRKLHLDDPEESASDTTTSQKACDPIAAYSVGVANCAEEAGTEVIELEEGEVVSSDEESGSTGSRSSSLLTGFQVAEAKRASGRCLVPRSSHVNGGGSRKRLPQKRSSHHSREALSRREHSNRHSRRLNHSDDWQSRDVNPSRRKLTAIR